VRADRRRRDRRAALHERHDRQAQGRRAHPPQPLHELHVAGQLFEFRDDDIGVAVLPLFHVFGLSSVLNVTTRFGGTLVLIPRFELEPVVDAIERHRCTIFSGVPTMYFGLLHMDTSGRDLSSLRVGVSGGAAIPGEVIRGFEEKFPGCVVLEGYGLSESTSTTTFNINAEQRKVLSIGKPIWGVTVQVVDESDKPLPPARSTSASSSSAATTS
jgi:long-chain acyl-CoA synthetase